MIMIFVVSKQDPDRLVEMKTSNPPASFCQILHASWFNSKLPHDHNDFFRQLSNQGIYNGRS